MRITAVVTSFAFLACLACLAVSAPTPAQAADVRSQGPIVSIGITDDNDGDLVHTGLGWRWELRAGDRADSIAERIGTKLNWVLEPQAAVLSNDRDGVEFQFLPMFQATPRRWADGDLVPYIEAGIGLIYIDVTGFDLGSQILFSDVIGLRMDFGRDERGNKWSLGYRFRHISHAGIWATSNDGMNTHWFTVSYQMGPH